MADNDKVISFFHGPEASIDSKISDGTISGADIIITSDTDSIYYVDADKSKHPLGSSKTKETHEVNVGGTIGGLSDGTEIPVGTTLPLLVASLVDSLPLLMRLVPILQLRYRVCLLRTMQVL